MLLVLEVNFARAVGAVRMQSVPGQLLSGMKQAVAPVSKDMVRAVKAEPTYIVAKY